MHLTIDEKIWLANALLLLHAIVVGITVAGCVALFTGRFKKFNNKDIFSWAFIACCLGQIVSLIIMGGCVFTIWEKQLRSEADPGSTYATNFLQQYLPFLPGWFISAVPILTIGALVGAAIQIYSAIKSRRNNARI